MAFQYEFETFGTFLFGQVFKFNGHFPVESLEVLFIRSCLQYKKRSGKNTKTQGLGIRSLSDLEPFPVVDDRPSLLAEVSSPSQLLISSSISSKRRSRSPFPYLSEKKNYKIRKKAHGATINRVLLEIYQVTEVGVIVKQVRKS